MKHIVSFLGAALLLLGCSRKEPEVTPSPPAPTPDVESVQHATPVVGKPGFVLSPYAPEKGYVDVRGFPKDTKVKDPYTGRIFLVPEETPLPPPPTPGGSPN